MATISIQDATALTAALATARGGESFALAPGIYPKVAISSRTFAPAISITSADPNNPAMIQAIAISKSAGVAFSHVDIGSPLKPAEPATVATAAGTINNSTGITFDQVHVHGSLDGNAGNDRYGLSFRGSSAIAITRSKFEQLARAALFGSCKGILVQDSTFMHLRSDGIDCADVQDVTIDGNFFGDYAPIEGDHPDAIQFWTNGTSESSADIRITNNQIQFGGAVGAQGIFLRDETNKLPYKRVTIDNNLIYVIAGYNGLAVGNAEDLTVTNNTVISWPRDKYKLRISLGTITRGKVAGNVADYLLLGTLVDVEQGDNLILSDQAAKLAIIPNATNGEATTYRDLVIPGQGYQPRSGAGLLFVPTAAAVAAAAAASVPKVTPAGSVLLNVTMAGGVPNDASSYRSLIVIPNSSDAGKPDPIATYKLNGRNYFEVSRGAVQLFDLSAFVLAFTIKRTTTTTGDGSIMRIHNSWYVSAAKGEIAFEYASADGKTYKLTSKGAKLVDLALHEVEISFDAAAGQLAFYVDGHAVGGGAIAGATKGPASWGLAVGNPFGASFLGEIGAVSITAGAKAPAAAIAA